MDFSGLHRCLWKLWARPPEHLPLMDELRWMDTLDTLDSPARDGLWMVLDGLGIATGGGDQIYGLIGIYTWPFLYFFSGPRVFFLRSIIKHYP